MDKIKKLILNLNTEKLLKICKILSLVSLVLLMPNILNFIKYVTKGTASDVITNKVKFMEDIQIISENLGIMFKIVIIGVTIISWILYIYIKSFEKNQCCNTLKTKTINIFFHTTLKESNFSINKINLNTEYKSEEFNVLLEMANLSCKKDGFEILLKNIIDRQDKKIEEFLVKNKNKEIGYMGISHVPLVTRAGYKVGDGIKVKLFHKKRKHENYDELDDNKEFPKFIVEKCIKKASSKELIVAVSTSYQIEDYQIERLGVYTKNLLKFKSEIQGVDVILSQIQLDSYLDTLLDKVRKFCRENKIEKIHMVLSTSISFEFALGQRLNSTYDPKIVVYHYDNNNVNKYPWGIDIFNKQNDGVVINL